MLVDTHCHIHDHDYPIDERTVLDNAKNAKVLKMLCVGTNEISSKEAITFANKYPKVAFAAVGVHPHDAKDGWSEIKDILESRDKKIVAVGEIGLDYHYNFSPKDVQIAALKEQIELAIKYDLPIIFHVREAYDDFWNIYDSFAGKKIRGVIHSFTDSPINAQKALKRGLYIGVNGYSTFTKDETQQAMFGELPLDKILLETDAPYLTPVPFRGKINEPAFVKNVAEYHAKIRNLTLEDIAAATTANASLLFNL